MSTARTSDAQEVITHIRSAAAALVRRVNPGRDYTAPWFAAKAAEVAEAFTRRVCLDLVDQGRADVARVIRIAWERDCAARARDQAARVVPRREA